MRIGNKLAVLGVTAVLVLGGAAAPANAYGSGSYLGWLCGGGWAGSSIYSGGVTYATTTKSDTSCSISAAVQIYQSYANKVTSSSSQVTATRPQLVSGGHHWLNGCGCFEEIT